MSEPGAVVIRPIPFPTFSYCQSLPLGVTEASGLGRLVAKNAMLEARVQVLEPITTNLFCCWQLPLGCGGASVLARLGAP